MLSNLFRNVGSKITIALLIIFQTSVLASDTEWMKPGDNVEAGKIYIKILPEYAPLNIKVIGGNVNTGIASLDAAADAFGVYDIEKSFKMEQTPDDPKVPDLSRYYTVYFPDVYPPVQLIEMFETCPEIEFAEWISLNKTYFTPNDARYRSQWHLPHCRLPEAWDISHGSQNVVIGIVDSGIDMPFNDFGEPMIHEDLLGNLWVNPGEDIDGDGVITLDDWNGLDDDRNGYVDDFYGWDLTGRDNWPHDIWARRGGVAHGTHVAGCASAATNNGIGVAGPGFNCRLMIAGCYAAQNDLNIANGYGGIEYCARNGADIINCSWGSLSPANRTERDVINYARAQGSIVFAAMGNDTTYDHQGIAMHHYPAAYDGVFGIAASNQHDNITEFSNWGDYVDLVAPGESIFATFTDNGYISYPGTSMASPFAAGIAALFLSEERFNEAQLLERMQRTAVDISGRNADYPGIRYRVDAAALLNSTRPEFEFSDFAISEYNGNNDGRPDPLEHIFFNITLLNRSVFKNASNVTISVTNPDTAIRITNPEVFIGNLSMEQEIRMAGQGRLSFYVHWFSKPHYSTFTFRITSDAEGEKVIEKKFIIGQPKYLLVDDDDGSVFETYYLADLLQRPIVHDTWEVSSKGPINAAMLGRYETVVWMTGNARNALSAAEQTAITSYLTNGGNLILSGQYIGDDHGNSDFHRNVLHAQHGNDNTGGRQLLGLQGRYTDGMNLLLIGGGGAGNGTASPSAIVPLDGAVAILNYQNTEDAGAIFYSGNYNLVYLGFALEAVSGANRTTTRAEFLERTIDHFFALDVPQAEETPVIPAMFSMAPAFPNPFNNSTAIRVKLPSNSQYRLEVVDLTGRRECLLFDGEAVAGSHSHTWDASGSAAGVYLIRMTFAGGELTSKVVLLK